MFSFVTSPEFWQPSARDPQTFDLYGSDQSLRWQDNHLGMTTHETVAEYFAIEVARFSVPAGQIGYVQHLEQVVNDVDGNYYPTSNEYWGSPHFMLADVNNLRWFLKLDFYNGVQPPRLLMSSAVPIPASSLPGYPYLDLPILNALWYPAHCNRRIKMVVPGNRILRFFAYSPPTTVYQWQLGGRLAGYTQTTYQDEAKENARSLSC